MQQQHHDPGIISVFVPLPSPPPGTSLDVVPFLWLQINYVSAHDNETLFDIINIKVIARLRLYPGQ